MIFVSDFYRKLFSCKVYKLSLDAACTCPNRDGTKGTGGCIFCSESGSGDFAAKAELSVEKQIEEAKAFVEKKVQGRTGMRKGKYIAYFQNFSSTYGDCKSLCKKYRAALECEDLIGLALATRPDCLSDEMLKELAIISKTHFVQIELGLQTSNEKTGNFINRCYTNEDYIDALRRIKKASPDIHIVTHLIFGLPFESEKDMMESVRFVVEKNQCAPSSVQDFFGIKITSLYILENTELAQLYKEGKVKALSKEDYYSLLTNALSLLPENCVIHRLTGDPPKKILIAPEWTKDKKRVLNDLSKIIRSL